MIKFLCLFSLIGFYSCSNTVEELYLLQIEARFDIPAAANTFDTHYFIIDRVPTFHSTFQGNVDPNSVTGILPQRALIDATVFDFDWSNVSRAAVYLSPIGNIDDRHEVFYLERIGFNEMKDLKLLSSITNVQDLLQQEFVTVQVALQFRSITPTEISSQIQMNFIAHGS